MARYQLAATAATILLSASTVAFAQHASPTKAEAEAFVAAAEAALLADSVRMNRILWVNETFLTDDTDALASEFGAESTTLGVRFALEAAKYLGVEGLSDDTLRKLNVMRSSVLLPAPVRAGAAQELSAITTRLTSAYGKGTGTLDGQTLDGDAIEEAMGTEGDPDRLKEMWASWHDTVGAPMKADYQRMVEIANEGAVELGYADVGAMWRSVYDMTPEEFSALNEKLWLEIKPLYDDLHCYVRGKLNQTYGDSVQPASGPIRADLLGNLWAQDWTNIYDMVAPEDVGDIGYDVTDLLTEAGYDGRQLVETAEAFFVSLGFPELPETFWERSMLEAPTDHDALCYASAWDIDNAEDVRLKMCVSVNAVDFKTVHHELGHNYYYLAYKDQPYLFMEGGNDGFHEAIGDMLALSMTPEYLVQIGLLDAAKVPSADKDIGLLLREALDRVAFMPFGLLVDKWRWGTFDGSIQPADYNTAWTKMRLDYQGIVPPVERGPDAFDPGGKYHIPGVTPYARYLLANVLMFQFYEAACSQAGWTGPLHRCSFYGNKDVGAKFRAMLAMGASRPWPDALEAFTGEREMSGKSMLAYFAPLHGWLKEQSAGKSCGW
ncbi:MAG: M2 family metallopeptidase [Rhizobiaceae bacterium]|nr:M2 family metallopeptidase [Rhizobiaceae bacterium]